VSRIKLRWHGKSCKRSIDKAVFKAMVQCAVVMTNYAKEKMSRSQPTSGAGLRKTGLNPSRPGEFPKKVTGQARRSVARDERKADMEVRVGTNIDYLRDLELGTSKTRPRPWLSRTWKETFSTMKALLKKASAK